jgi:chromatin modification-related protein EAF6
MRFAHPLTGACDQQTAIEENIHRTETQYLEETTAGNIIKGFDNYIKGSAAVSTAGTGPGTSTRRKPTISDADRIFSKSSSSFNNVSQAQSGDVPHRPRF